jgi:LysM repeat protein
MSATALAGGFQIQRDDGSVARQGVTDAEGFLKFEDLPYGPYTVVEEDRPGWNELTPRELEINVSSGGCILVPFENEQDDSGFCIEGYKLDVNGGYGIAGWEITADPVEDGGPEAIVDEVLTDGTGKYRFDYPRNDYRVPGGLVEICEDDDVDGWEQRTPNCQRVELPKWPMACVQLEPFVNAQVGHDDGQKHDDKGGKDGKDGHDNGDPNGGGSGPYNGNGDPNGGNSGPYNGGDQNGGKDGQYDHVKCSQVHVVAKGEGLYAIGDSYGVSAQAMLDANPWVRDVEGYVLHPGQKVCIP